MNRGKIFSGVAALVLYMLLILSVLFFYNIHQVKAKNYVEKNENRVTVTLVNSDKTVFNRSDETSNKNKPTPMVVPPIPLKSSKNIEHTAKATPKVSKTVPKVSIPKQHIVKKVVKPKPKKRVTESKKRPKKKVVSKKIAPKKVPKKVVKKRPKKKEPKKVIKKVPKKKVPKKKVPKKKVPKKVVPKKKTPKKSAKDLFSSVKTKDTKKSTVKKRPKSTTKRPKQPSSSIKHRSSVADRIKSSHQSGRTSNANRDKGIKNAYIAKVKRHMNNWNAAPAYKGKRVTIALTIYNSGKFSYRIIQGSGNIRGSLSQYLDRLKRIGLGRHNKSTPYSIKVSFTVR
jgi:hypothetical protein